MDVSGVRGQFMPPPSPLDVVGLNLQDGQLLLYRVPPLSENGLLLALQGTKDAPIGMMRAKVHALSLLLYVIVTGRIDCKIPRETVE